MNTGVLLRMVRFLSVLVWELNKGLRLVVKTAMFDMDSYTIKRTFCTLFLLYSVHNNVIIQYT